MTITLSAGEIAELAGVKRPVVTIWKGRPVPEHPFPTADEDDRYPADEVLDWLEATGRGNNRHARVDFALKQALSPNTPTEVLEDLLALAAARCVVGEELSGLDPEDVLDAVEEADGDDEWLWSEVEHADFQLAPLVDLAVGASWSPEDAHDRILSTLEARRPAQHTLGSRTVALLADTVRYCLSPGGAVVDVAGSATTAVLELQRDEDLPEIEVVVPGAGRDVRLSRQRMDIRSLPNRSPRFSDDWELSPGSVAVLRLPVDTDEAWNLLEETSMQLGRGMTCLALGTPDQLIGPLGAASAQARARLLRARLLRATVELPHRRDGRTVVEQVLWVLSPVANEQDDLQRMMDALTGRRRPLPPPTTTSSVVDTTFADLSTATRTSQALVLDLAAAASGDHRHRMRVLRPVRLRVPDPGEGIQMARGTFTDELGALPVDDAARINELLQRLSAQLPETLAQHEATAARRQAASLVTVGDAVRRSMLSVHSGLRAMADVPRGGQGLVWTAAAVTLGRPEQMDLTQLKTRVRRGRRTRPGDVVFSNVGKPSAVVDTAGGALVAFPLRALHVRGDAELSPAGIASAINALPPDSGAWREWRIPLATYRARADDFLRLVEDYEQELESRKNAVQDLRRLVARSVPTGAVQLRAIDDDDKEGR